MKKLVLVDGSGFIYRAFFALPPLTRSDGTPIGAVFGFTNILISMLTNNSMDYFAIVFDKGKKCFRHDMYPEYKQNRRETPPELGPQFKIIREVCHAFNVPCIEEDNYEADDLIASYSQYALENGFTVKVVSGDKDLIQLIREGVELYDPLKAKEITHAEVMAKYGIRPEQMIDFLALCGDASDNIPGVSSVGPKTAAGLLNEFGDLTHIIEEVTKIEKKKKVHLKLMEERDLAFLSQKLATTDMNAPRNTPIESLRTQNVDIQAAKEFLEAQEFNSLIPKLNGIKHKATEKEFVGITNLNENASSAGILLINDLTMKTADGHEALIDPKSKEFLKMLDDSSILKITNNAKRLMHISSGLSNFEDLSIMSFLANGKDSSFSVSHDSFLNLQRKLVNTGQWDTYVNVEKPLIRILYNIEKAGFRVDAEKLEKLTEFFDKLLKTIKDNIFILAGKEINLDSPKQVSDLLFNHLHIRYFKRLKRGETPHTNQAVLEELADAGYEIASHIIEWRQVSKLRSTYSKALVQKIDPETSRIHTTFNITKTITGRLSSSDPNLQNIPVKTNIGMKIREAFIAPRGSVLISMDYSQIELRVLAHLSGCPKLLKAFQENSDIHTLTASEIFHVPTEEVTDDLRRKAKAINFGIIYGMTSFGVSKRVKMSNSEASQFIENYFSKYPSVKSYIDTTIKKAYEFEYLNTILGRRCFIPNIKAKNAQLRKFAERQAVNAPIQGSSADIMSVAMVRITECKDIKARMILQIHDELIFEAKAEEAEHQAELIKSIMESLNLISCPLKVNSSTGTTWGSL